MLQAGEAQAWARQEGREAMVERRRLRPLPPQDFRSGKLGSGRDGSSGTFVVLLVASLVATAGVAGIGACLVLLIPSVLTLVYVTGRLRDEKPVDRRRAATRRKAGRRVSERRTAARASRLDGEV